MVPDGDPGKLVTATATLAALVGMMLLVARLLRLGFVANFISTPVLTGFKAGIGLVVVLDQVPKLFGFHITKQGFFQDVLSVLHHLPQTSMVTLAMAVATCAVLISMERLWPHSPAPLVAVGGSIAASWFFSLQAMGVSTGGPDPAGNPVHHLAGCCAGRATGAGRAGYRADGFTETIAAGRAFARPGEPPIDANRELVATGLANIGGALLGAMPAGGEYLQWPCVPVGRARGNAGCGRAKEQSAPAPSDRYLDSSGQEGWSRAATDLLTHRDMLGAEAKRLGFQFARVIETKEIAIEPWVRLKCRFGCSLYGSSLTCPPFSPDEGENEGDSFRIHTRIAGPGYAALETVPRTDSGSRTVLLS